MNNSRQNKKATPSVLYKREKRVCSIGDAVSSMFDRLGGGRERSRLNQLWKNWASIMGDQIASLSYPLGQSEGTLRIGADDAMAMQELSFLSQEVLEQANEFMGSIVFTKMTVSLMQGRPDLARPRAGFGGLSGAESLMNPSWLVPEKVGGRIDAFTPDSPVTSCYLAHAAAGRKKG